MTDNVSGTVVILGATSAMAEHAARIHAARGDSLVLVARSTEKLEAIAGDLRARGAREVRTFTEDLARVDGIGERVGSWLPSGTNLARAYIFYGILGDQEYAQKDLGEAEDLMRTNYTSAALWSLALANRLEAQGKGALVGISSVAGDRGRMSNHIYGSAKAGFTALLQGIDHRLSKAGARAVAIKFGFVISPMTEGMPRSGPLWTTAEKAGELAVKAGDKKRGAVYAPFFWRYIMLIIRLLPTFVINRTKL